MKKLSLFFLIFSFFNSAESQVSIGPLVGLNFSTVKGGVNDQNNKFKLGYYAGGFMKFEFSDVVSFQPEMLFSQRGYKQKSSTNSSSVSADSNITHSFSYLDFPFLLNAAIGERGILQIGPQIGYIINAKERGSITSSSNSSTQIQNVDTSNIYGFSTTEYSLVAGGTYRFKFPLTVSLRAVYGITKLYDGENSSHNLSFQFFVGYVFGNNSGGGGNGIIYKRL
ncbi:MAG: PorT family protein [Bacteroidetes bacterium]|nr:PorT family protein [Bacteroidota bacterium]